MPVSDPILFVVDGDPDTLTSLASTLQRRFGGDGALVIRSGSRARDWSRVGCGMNVLTC